MQFCDVFILLFFAVRLVRKFASGAPIFGVASLGSYLYVGRASCCIDVYDKATGIWQQNVNVPDLRSIYDMVACSTIKCIYIADWKALSIFKVVEPMLTRQRFWPIDGVIDISGLSTDNVGHVLVTCRSKPPTVGMVKVFYGCGTIQCEILLQPDIFKNPHHSVKVILKRSNHEIHRYRG